MEFTTGTTFIALREAYRKGQDEFQRVRNEVLVKRDD